MMRYMVFAILALLSIANGLTAIEGIELNDYVIRNNWDLVQKSLNQQRVIRLCKETLSEDSLNRILSLQLPIIEELHFTDDQQVKREGYGSSMLILTQTLVLTIFTSSYFPRISVLNLGWGNLDDRSLRFLQGSQLRTTLKELNLQRCLIGKKGYRYLSNIQFLNLKVLNVEDTLLKETQAVDSLISIICGKEAGKCRNDLQELNIAKTSIQRDNFIRLMKQINSQPLQRLNINYLSMIYNGTYNDGFIYSAFQALTAFNNLRILNMKTCDLDDTAAAIFANWTLPFLTTLNLQNNHLSEKGLMAWVTKLNMPSLTHLNINKNAVGDEAIFHFATEDFEFESLRLMLAKFTAHGIEKLNLMDLRMLKMLEFGFNMPTKILNSFIQGDDFPNLQQLIIRQNDLFINPFTKINWKKLSKLRSLTILTVNLRTSVEDLMQNTEPIIPSLKKLTLDNTELSDLYCIAFLTTIKTAFPNLQHIVIRQLQEITIFPDVLLQLQLREGFIIEIDQNILVKRRNIFQVIRLTEPQFLFMNSNYQEMTLQAIQNRIPTIASLYDFNSMEVLGFDGLQIAIYFFKVLKQGHITSLPRLRQFAFFFKLPYETMLDILANIEMPNLRAIILQIIVPSDASEDDIQSTLYPFFRKFPLLQGLLLTISFLNEERGDWQRKMFMNSLYYPFLADVQMYGMNMELEQITNFVKAHNQTLRILNFGNNFLEKGFLQLLVDSKYALLALSLEATSFTVEEFAILGKVNTQFMSTLILSQNDLTNQHIFAMMKLKEGRPLFPKLSTLNLAGNDIRKQGLQVLLQSQLLLLTELHISENSNPEYVNLLFSYPTKISSLQALDVDVYGVKKDLNSKAARSLTELYLKTKSFISQDFANLAKLQFSELRIGIFDVHNVYDCQTLQNMLQMTKDALFLMFDFHNDVKGLNSSCLKATEYQSRACCLNIFDYSGTTYLPQFALSLLNTDSSLKEIMLIDTKFPPQFFRKVFTQSSFSQLQALSLYNNYVGDEAFKIFLNSDLSNLEYLFMINVQITDSSIEGLSLAKLPALQELALSKNKLSKRAMESLRKMKAEKLRGLYLANCGLKADSLDVIGTFRMEQLVAIYLSHNDFQEEEAIQFVSDLHRKNLPSLSYFQMKGISLSKANYDAVVQILQAKSIQFALDPPHNTHRANSAKY